MDIARPGQYLGFQLGEMAYGLPIGLVREINRVLAITPMPETPPYVTGVMNLRGKVIPILDLRMRFSIPLTPYTKQTCIIVVDTESGQCGLLVDKILAVVTFASDHIQPRPALRNDEALQCVNGMGKVNERIFALIEIEKTLSKDLKNFTKAA